MTTLRADLDRLPDRIAVKLLPQGDCWIWIGCVAGKYGHVRNHGQMFQAHRLVYELLVGPIPDGLTLDHLCRVTTCCNPAHLEPVTNRVNQLRGESFSAVNARKTHCVNGHPFDESNTGHRYGWRFCRTCHTARNRKARNA